MDFVASKDLKKWRGKNFAFGTATDSNGFRYFRNTLEENSVIFEERRGKYFCVECGSEAKMQDVFYAVEGDLESQLCLELPIDSSEHPYCPRCEKPPKVF